MKRRDFLKTSSVAGGAVLSSWAGGDALAQEAAPREFYELRVYELLMGTRRAVLNEYLEKALIPALNRFGCRPIGVFSAMIGGNSLSQFVLIPYPDLSVFGAVPEKLASDEEYRRTAEPYLSAAFDSPVYVRYESTLMQAFRSMPRLRVPAEASGNKPRLLELRTYESPSERTLRKKIEMFEEGGEIGIFDKVGLRSVFYGQTLIGRRQPNLLYMTVHADMPARDRAWEAFRTSAEWKALSPNPQYTNIQSASTVEFLRPAAYSQI